MTDFLKNSYQHFSQSAISLGQDLHNMLDGVLFFGRDISRPYIFSLRFNHEIPNSTASSP
jgi:hypothetical protein